MDLLAPCDEFFDWHACRIQGRDTYVYVHMLRDGALAADYNPTELDVAPGDRLEVLGIQGAWLLRAMRRVAAADGFRPRRRAL